MAANSIDLSDRCYCNQKNDNCTFRSRLVCKSGWLVVCLYTFCQLL